MNEVIFTSLVDYLDDWLFTYIAIVTAENLLLTI